MTMQYEQNIKKNKQKNYRHRVPKMFDDDI